MLGHLLELLMKLDGTAWCNHLKALQGPTTPSVAMKRGYYMRLQTSRKIHKKYSKQKRFQEVGHLKISACHPTGILLSKRSVGKKTLLQCILYNTVG